MQERLLRFGCRGPGVPQLHPTPSPPRWPMPYLGLPIHGKEVLAST